MKPKKEKSRYTLQLEMDILTAVLAHEMGTMSFMMTEITEGERQFYKAVEHIALERIPADLLQMLERNHAYERAHMMLLQLGFNAWELCGLRKNGKRISRL